MNATWIIGILTVAYLATLFDYMRLLRSITRLEAETERLRGELAVAKLGQRIALRD